METVFQLLTPALMFVSSLLGYDQALLREVPEQQAPSSVELGLKEVSPVGESGGFAIPASGCSATNPNPNPNWGNGSHPDTIGCPAPPTPKITADQPIIRVGDTVRISWDPNGDSNCLLSNSVTSLPPTPTNANAPGSRNDTPEGQTAYTIICDNGAATVVVKVLIQIEET